MEQCCICGKALPNRYAVAGRCEAAGCGKPFCALHWVQGNHKCPDHGFLGRGGTPAAAPEQAPGPELEGQAREAGPAALRSEEGKNIVKEQDEAPIAPVSKTRVAGRKARAAMAKTIELAGRLGAQARDLVKKLKKDRSPEAMITTLEGSLAAVVPRREAVSARVEALYSEVARKKQAWTRAAAARRRVLEAELKSKLAEYKAAERELRVLLENERHLNLVKGRLLEMTAYGMAGLSEDMMDDVGLDVEEMAASAEGRSDAARDLDGIRTSADREGDREEFLEELSGFELDETVAAVSAEEQEPALPGPLAEAETAPSAESNRVEKTGTADVEADPDDA